MNVPGVKWFAVYDPQSPGADAARTLLRDRYDRLARVLHDASLRPDDARIRKLRVATRRADAAVRFAAPLLEHAAAAGARRALRQLRRAAGGVRRCDLFIARLAPLMTDPAARDLAAAAATTIGILTAQRSDAAQTMRRGIERALCGVPAPALDPERDAPAPELAVALLRASAAAFVRASEPRASDLEAMHTLRLRGKRLRYAVEAVAPVIGHPAAARIIDTLVPIQDELGTINDLAELAALIGSASAELVAIDPPRHVLAGMERLFITASAERDRRAAAFARERPSRLGPILRAVAEARPEAPAPVLRIADAAPDARSDTA